MAASLESEASKVKAGIVDSRDPAFRDADRKPLSDHLVDWRAAMIAKGRTLPHANLSHNRTAKVATLAKADGRLRDDPMLGVTGYNASEDVRHARRSLSDEEMAALVRATADGPERLGMNGPDRTMAYRLAAGTGFWVNELRSLTPESFRLDGPRPYVTLRPAAANARHRRGRRFPSEPSHASPPRRERLSHRDGRPTHQRTSCPSFAHRPGWQGTQGEGIGRDRPVRTASGHPT